MRSDRYYKVKQGDWLSKIARTFGIPNWHVIWDDPKNEPLRTLRKSPNILYPGDQVYIPGSDSKEIICGTDKRHVFVVKGDDLKICVQVSDGERKPRPGVPYTLQAGPITIKDETTPDGKIEKYVPSNITAAIEPYPDLVPVTL